MINLETIEVNGLLTEFAYLELENSLFDGYTDEGMNYTPGVESPLLNLWYYKMKYFKWLIKILIIIYEIIK